MWQGTLDAQFVKSIEEMLLVLAGQLKVLVQHLQKEENAAGAGAAVPTRVLHKLVQLQAMADRVSDVTSPYIRATQPNYYQRQYQLQDSRFKIHLFI